MQEGRLWPTDNDRQALQARFWVSARQTPDISGESALSGISSVVVTETPDQTDKRLNQEFPVFKVVQFGKRILRFIPKETSHEV